MIQSHIVQSNILINYDFIVRRASRGRSSDARPSFQTPGEAKRWGHQRCNSETSACLNPGVTTGETSAGRQPPGRAWRSRRGSSRGCPGASPGPVEDRARLSGVLLLKAGSRARTPKNVVHILSQLVALHPSRNLAESRFRRAPRARELSSTNNSNNSTANNSNNSNATDNLITITITTPSLPEAWSRWCRPRFSAPFSSRLSFCLRTSSCC